MIRLKSTTVGDTENGGAVAPDKVPVGGYSQFAISVKGTLDDDDDDNFENIDGEDIMVMVRVQRSGGGMAAVSPMTVNAGDVMSTITVTYTADGQVDNGLLKLTIPAKLGCSDVKQRYDRRRRRQYRCEIWR